MQNNCTHARTIPGVEGDWCPECQKLVPSRPTSNQVVKSEAAKLLETIPTAETLKNSTDADSKTVGTPRKKRGRPKQQSWIYFIRSGNAVKIGVTTDIRRRLYDLQVASPTALELVGVHLGDRKTEEALHHRFRNHQIRGEWFRWCDPIQRYVSLIVDGKAPKSGAKPKSRMQPLSDSESLKNRLDQLSKTVGSESEFWQVTLIYRSHGSLYYRYVYGKAHKVLHCVHIPGGNTDNPIAAARREQVDRWIRQNQSPDTIVKMISRWK